MAKKVYMFTLAISFIASLVNAQTPQTYGNALAQNITDNPLEGYCGFICDINDFPPIIGQEIAVIIDNITPIETKDPNDDIKTFILETLNSAKAVELRNMRRADNAFAIKADVLFDGKNLAYLLISKGYAKKIENDQQPEKDDRIERIEFCGSKNSKVFHKSDCRCITSIAKENLVRYKSKGEATEKDKRPCKVCQP